jgi:hypothetical protein
MARDLRIPRLYKTLLALAAVLGPIAWLLLAGDGQRRTDLVLMRLLGRPSFDAALDAFSDRLDEARLRQAFPDLVLGCTDSPNPFGDRLCTAGIGSFDGWPARAAVFYLRDRRLSAVKVVYQGAYHDRLRAWVAEQAARHGPEGGHSVDIGSGKGVDSWAVPGGMLVMKSGELGPGDEPALLWLSPTALQQDAGPSGPGSHP